MKRIRKWIGLWIGLIVLLSTVALAVPFTDNGDNTVTDKKTELIWQQQDDNTTRTWEMALGYCETLTHAGKSDWRLPNIRELESIVDLNEYYPSIDEVYFPNTKSGYYWSSTTYARSDWYALSVHFLRGSVGEDANGFGSVKTDSFYVRCVR